MKKFEILLYNSYVNGKDVEKMKVRDSVVQDTG